jgi:2-amino-4-hydroxy-6-hydroxymethyldihydropteridine diphosphokinase
MVIISFGGNIKGRQGMPLQTMRWAIERMSDCQIQTISTSSFYSSKPLGQSGQDDYINGVVCVKTAMSAANLLKNLKRIEQEAGRDNQPLQIEGRWGARSLDLDIIDYKGLVSRNYFLCTSNDQTISRSNARRCDLVLPHPQAHLRPFVIKPIIDIDSLWHHPVSGLSVHSLWASMSNCGEGRILHKVS